MVEIGDRCQPDASRLADTNPLRPCRSETSDAAVGLSNLAAALGYSPDAKLLIIHADDLGMCHSVNSATFVALERRVITSTSIMVPCPWFTEAVDYLVRSPVVDLGVHLTLTSEWKHYKWRPVSPNAESTGLTDRYGNFVADAQSLDAGPHEIEEEVSAQIRRALQSGLVPSHVDSHMFSLFRPEFIQSYLNVARSFGLPFFAPRWISDRPGVAGTLFKATDIIVDTFCQITPSVAPSAWKEFYIGALRRLKPGLSQLIVHPGFDNHELRSIAGSSEPWGAEWRHRRA
jgi:chitin disaccharide deacetylase